MWAQHGAATAAAVMGLMGSNEWAGSWSAGSEGAGWGGRLLEAVCGSDEDCGEGRPRWQQRGQPEPPTAVCHYVCKTRPLFI